MMPPEIAALVRASFGLQLLVELSRVTILAAFFAMFLLALREK
jgi:hypothetical protein